MLISPETIKILKNFSTINSNILVKPGNVLKTTTLAKNIYGQATVAEKFDRQFGIWDLNKFLAVLSLYKEPNLEFEDKYVTISSADQKTSIKYYFSDANVLAGIPPEGYKPPAHNVQFDISEKDLAQIQKAASVLQVPDLCIESEDDGIYIRVFDKKDSTTNSYKTQVVPGKPSVDLAIFFKIEHLRMIPGDYTVRITGTKVAQFIHASGNLLYCVSAESDSDSRNK